MGHSRGMENLAGTQRHLDCLLSVPAQLVDWSLGGRSAALIDPAQVVFKTYVRLSGNVSQLIRNLQYL